MKAVLFLLLLTGLLTVSGIAVFLLIIPAEDLQESPSTDKISLPADNIHPSPPLFEPTISPTAPPAPLKTPVAIEYIDHQVPFTSQAPLGQWNEPEFQDGCEEASVLMAVSWARGQKIANPQAATAFIQEISDWQKAEYGEFRDRSVVDTADLIGHYMEFDNFEVKTDISIGDIKQALMDESVVIVPAAGQELNNPNFTPPGPLNHMLVIRGYDPSTKEFITNDPGTRNGEGFRYREDVLWKAIRDYPTGFKEPITVLEKNMIVVSRQ